MESIFRSLPTKRTWAGASIVSETLIEYTVSRETISREFTDINREAILCGSHKSGCVDVDSLRSSGCMGCHKERVEGDIFEEVDFDTYGYNLTEVGGAAQVLATGT